MVLTNRPSWVLFTSFSAIATKTQGPTTATLSLSAFQLPLRLELLEAYQFFLRITRAVIADVLFRWLGVRSVTLRTIAVGVGGSWISLLSH